MTLLATPSMLPYPGSDHIAGGLGCEAEANQRYQPTRTCSGRVFRDSRQQLPYLPTCLPHGMMITCHFWHMQHSGRLCRVKSSLAIASERGRSARSKRACIPGTAYCRVRCDGGTTLTEAMVGIAGKQMSNRGTGNAVAWPAVVFARKWMKHIAAVTVRIGSGAGRWGVP